MFPEKPQRTCRKWHRESAQMWELPIALSSKQGEIMLKAVAPIPTAVCYSFRQPYTTSGPKGRMKDSEKFGGR